MAIIQEIATAAGTRDGMVGGQVADLEAEGQPANAGNPGIHSSLENGGADSGIDRVRSAYPAAPATTTCFTCGASAN